jgi:hypothetical protein
VGVATVGTHFGGPVYVGKGLIVDGAITATTVVSSSNGFVSTNGFDVVGNITMTDGALLNTKGVVTVTDGIQVSGAISVASGLTVTSWSRFYGLALVPATTCVVTSGYSITPGNYSLVYLVDDGTRATGAITMSAVTSVISGTYQGQLLMVMCIDGDGALLTIPDNPNTALTGDVQLGISDTLTLMWNGYDWVELAACDN